MNRQEKQNIKNTPIKTNRKQNKSKNETKQMNKINEKHKLEEKRKQIRITNFFKSREEISHSVKFDELEGQGAGDKKTCTSDFDSHEARQ